MCVTFRHLLLYCFTRRSSFSFHFPFAAAFHHSVVSFSLQAVLVAVEISPTFHRDYVIFDLFDELPDN